VLGYGAVVEVSDAAARQNDDIEASQCGLIVPVRFANLALHAVAPGCPPAVLLADDDPQACMPQPVRAREHEQFACRNPEPGVVENCLELRGVRQAYLPGIFRACHTSPLQALSGRQALAALRAAALQHDAPVARGHACAEAMGTLALEVARLECSFAHGVLALGAVQRIR